MPRKSTGHPHWKAMAVKLPEQLIAEVRRYADLYDITISELIRQGLDMRLHGPQQLSQLSDNTVIPDTTVTMLTRLATTLTAAAEQLRSACAGTIGVEEKERQSTPGPQEYNGNTKYNGNTTYTVSRTARPPESQPDAQPASTSSVNGTVTPAPAKTALSTSTQPTLRQRILTLLEAHPDGLDATHIRVELHRRRSVLPLLSTMVQEHLLERQGSGQAARYRRGTAPSMPVPQAAETVTESQNGEIAIPSYDATKYVLGKLCPQRHEWGTTGQSLLSLPSHTCKECKKESKRRKRAQKHQGQPA